MGDEENINPKKSIVRTTVSLAIYSKGRKSSSEPPSRFFHHDETGETHQCDDSNILTEFPSSLPEFTKPIDCNVLEDITNGQKVAAGCASKDFGECDTVSEFWQLIEIESLRHEQEPAQYLTSECIEIGETAPDSTDESNGSYNGTPLVEAMDSHENRTESVSNVTHPQPAETPSTSAMAHSIVPGVKRQITDFFASHSHAKTKRKGNLEVNSAPKKARGAPWKQQGKERSRKLTEKSAGQLDGAKLWETIPGTSFRVDGFRHLSKDCSHWFLTHFHTDHYQGITKGFRFGKIYCSAITATLLKLKIGLSDDQLCVLPLDSRVDVDGVKVTFLDANHCPGAVMILFEPPESQAVLHTGDFRWCLELEQRLNSVLADVSVDTLILDTTYCNPKFSFPPQETVIQLVTDIIAAELFNPRTLCLIGTYSIGKEKLFLDVGKALRKKIYVGMAKRRLLDCLQVPEEDMQWVTDSQEEACIHAVPLWSIANFKRMESISRHYKDHFDTFVAFCPTGWSYNKGKTNGPGRRSRKGSLIRYEVPYSEHCSFEELRRFVAFVDPATVVPSVNGDGEAEAEAMVKLLSD